MPPGRGLLSKFSGRPAQVQIGEKKKEKKQKNKTNEKKIFEKNKKGTK